MRHATSTTTTCTLLSTRTFTHLCTRIPRHTITSYIYIADGFWNGFRAFHFGSRAGVRVREILLFCLKPTTNDSSNRNGTEADKPLNDVHLTLGNN